MAKHGNNVAKTVIGISNQMNLKSVNRIQRKMGIFDPKTY